MSTAPRREPLLRVVSRPEKSPRQVLLLRLESVLLSLAAGGIFILLIGYNPFEIYATILSGAFRSKMAVQATVKYAVPLVIASLGVTLAFRMRFWNIGAEGQIIMGAVFASYFALFHAGWNHWLLIAVMLLAGALGGGLWGLIPALCKVRWNTNETLLTLMLNYIALHIVSYLRDGPWRDMEAAGFSKIARFDKNAALDKVLGVHFGWIIALLLAAAVFVYLGRTKQGYEIAVVGESQETARYAGMNVRRIILRTMALSGAVCGLGGMIQATGADITLTTAVAGGVGFTAIIVAWLAQLNAPMILVVSILFSVLEKGAGVVQSTYGISSNCAAVLQGIILFFILGCEFFVRYTVVPRGKGAAGMLLKFLVAAIAAGTPLLFGTVGEILNERVGHLNLGVEGMMAIGACAGFMAGYLTDSFAAALIAAFLAGMLAALIYAVLTVTFLANQNVTGLALTIFGEGLSNFIGVLMISRSETKTLKLPETITAHMRSVSIPGLSDLPAAGELFFSYNPFVYLGIVTALAAGYYLHRTKTGLNVRAVGENPAAADAAGINVTRTKYVNILLGGGICGIGGAYCSMIINSGVWISDSVGGLGWIAVALVIFAGWKPGAAIAGSFLFGGLRVLKYYVPKGVIEIPIAFYDMLPFLITALVLVLGSMKKSRGAQIPASLGLNYFREER